MTALILWLVVLFAWLVSLGFYRNPLYLGIGFVFLVLGAGAVIFWGLAPANKWFTFVREGSVKIIARGTGFAKALIQWKGYTFDEQWNVIREGWHKNGVFLEVVDVIDARAGKVEAIITVDVEEWFGGEDWIIDGEPRNGFSAEVLAIIDEAEGKLEVAVTPEGGIPFEFCVAGAKKIWVEKKALEEVEGAAEYKEPRHPFGGLRLYGVWPVMDVFIYVFRWTGITENGSPRHKEEWLDYALLKDDVYLAVVDAAEDSNLLPLKLELLLTIWVANPYKAVFKIQNWLEAVINRIKPVVRSYITTNEFKNWVGKRDVLGKELMAAIDKAGLISEFLEKYGVGVKKVEVKEINPPDGYREKTLAPYLAELDKKATVIRAEGERDATAIKAEGEQKAIEKVFEQIQKFGHLGIILRALDAVRTSPLAASLLAIPGLQELFHGVFGKGLATATLEDIRQLREMIEEMNKKIK